MLISKLNTFVNKKLINYRIKCLNNSKIYLCTNNDNKTYKIKEHHVEKTPMTAYLWKQRVSSITNDPVIIPDNPLLEKSSIDSLLKLTYDFTSDFHLRDQYSDERGNVLVGKILEDLDAFAGNIAYRHCIDQSVPNDNNISLVTASVDKISMSKAFHKSNRHGISIDKDDVILIGQVCYVGSSSLDVIIEIHSKSEVLKYNIDGKPIIISDQGSCSRLLSCFFTYVARNRRTRKSIKINRFICSNEYEIKLFNEREELAKARKSDKHKTDISKQKLQSLVEKGCSIEDMPALAHPNAVLMKATALENSFICQPQSGNTAGRVFGGFLMHRAYDLALATGYTFAGSYPQFREVDKIIFKSPVDIGDLIRLKSRIVNTIDDPIHPLAQVEVTCQIIKPEKASSIVSNTFNFEFIFDNNITLRKVLPTTYEEATVLINASKSAESSVLD